MRRLRLAMILATTFTLGVFVFLAYAQESCPLWAQERLAELQQQAFQLGIEAGLTGQLDMARQAEIYKKILKLPKSCLQESVQPEEDQNQALCEQKKREYTRCRTEFNKRVAGGLDPTYTCMVPNC